MPHELGSGVAVVAPLRLKVAIKVLPGTMEAPAQLTVTTLPESELATPPVKLSDVLERIKPLKAASVKLIVNGASTPEPFVRSVIVNSFAVKSAESIFVGNTAPNSTTGSHTGSTHVCRRFRLLLDLIELKDSSPATPCVLTPVHI